MISNGQLLSTSLFLSCLKRLNSGLRVYSSENSFRLAGLYRIDITGNYESICGVDKNYVPAYATFDNGGHVIKSGWRRVFWILLWNGYTTHAKIRQVCRGFFDEKACSADKFVGGESGDPIQNRIDKYLIENDSEVLSADQAVEVATAIRKKDSSKYQEEREHEKWFLETWKKRGGGLSDKPAY